MSEAPKEIYWTPVSLSAKHDVGVDAIGFAWRTDREDRVTYILKTEAQAATDKAVAEALREAADVAERRYKLCERDNTGPCYLRRCSIGPVILALIPPEQQETEQ